VPATEKLDLDTDQRRRRSTPAQSSRRFLLPRTPAGSASISSHVTSPSLAAPLIVPS
jgi:hypothetical protein